MKKLNLIVNNHDGVKLLSPFIQDSIISFVHFNPENKEFEMHMNRFAHEHHHHHSARINSYLAIPTANAVHHKGLHKEIEDLNLLALDSQDKKNQHYLFFIFSEHKTIRITMPEMFFRIWDFGDHWIAERPEHLFIN